MSTQPNKLTTIKPSKDKKLAKAANISITEINPDVYMASPRPGGVIKIIPFESQNNVKNSIKLESESPTCCKSQASTSVYYSTSKEKRLNLALEVDDWDLKNKTKSNDSEEFSDNMLAITISCVMHMAAKAKQIPEEHIVFAEQYLCCIKDDKGIHPPNVQGILNYIRYLLLKKSKNESNKDKKQLDYTIGLKKQNKPKEKKNDSDVSSKGTSLNFEESS